MARYGYITEAQAAHVRDAARRAGDNGPLRDLVAWAVAGHSFNVEYLDEWAWERVQKWAAEAGADLDALRVLCFTTTQAQAVFGSRRAAQEVIRQAVESGALVRIATGVHGHASLYVLPPVPEIVPNSESETDTNTPNRPAGEPWRELVENTGHGGEYVPKNAESVPNRKSKNVLNNNQQ